MATASIDYWFTMGSTYNYLTAMRIDAVAQAAGVAVRWRPFRHVGALTGATQLPFLEGTAKMRYMWRDIERRAAARGLPLRLPVTYPCPSSARANAVMLIGAREGWGPAYARAAYPLWFGQGIANGGEENLRAALAACGQGAEADRIIALADSPETLAALEAETDEARSLGVFGAPTFAVGGELFWGDDHLEDALHWAKHGRLAPAPALA
jgi:2-hydroxychromene-2-carboxylate isomerase